MIVILSPLLIGIGIAVRLSSPGKAVFCQERVGKNEKRFMIYKFRTMKNPPEGTYSKDGILYKPSGEILEPSASRITKLRKIFKKNQS